MQNILKNKKCFITGATGALGFELARLFAKNKCNVKTNPSRYKFIFISSIIPGIKYRCFISCTLLIESK